MQLHISERFNIPVAFITCDEDPELRGEMPIEMASDLFKDLAEFKKLPTFSRCVSLFLDTRVLKALTSNKKFGEHAKDWSFVFTMYNSAPAICKTRVKTVDFDEQKEIPFVCPSASDVQQGQTEETPPNTPEPDNTPQSSMDFEKQEIVTVDVSLQLFFFFVFPARPIAKYLIA